MTAGPSTAPINTERQRYVDALLRQPFRQTAYGARLGPVFDPIAEMPAVMHLTAPSPLLPKAFAQACVLLSFESPASYQVGWVARSWTGRIVGGHAMCPVYRPLSASDLRAHLLNNVSLLAGSVDPRDRLACHRVCEAATWSAAPSSRRPLAAALLSLLGVDYDRALAALTTLASTRAPIPREHRCDAALALAGAAVIPTGFPLALAEAISRIAPPAASRVGAPPPVVHLDSLQREVADASDWLVGLDRASPDCPLLRVLAASVQSPRPIELDIMTPDAASGGLRIRVDPDRPAGEFICLPSPAARSTPQAAAGTARGDRHER